MTVSDTTKNQGGAASPAASTTAFYLSTNAAFDAADVLLGSRPVPALAPGAVSTAARPRSPSRREPAAGSYYLLARADSDAAVPGDQRGQQHPRRPVVAVGADLAVSALTAPAAGGAGATMSVSDTTKNQGGGPAPASVTQFFFSTNTVLDAADPLLGLARARARRLRATSTATTSLTIPAGTTAGNYYLMARADGDGARRRRPTRPTTPAPSSSPSGADLAVTALTAPAEAGAGATIDVTDTTKNQGGGAGAPASTTVLPLRERSLRRRRHSSLGARSVPALGPGATSAACDLAHLPRGTRGRHLLHPRAGRRRGRLPETNESNNTRAALVAVGPDLAVTALTVPAAAGAGAADHGERHHEEPGGRSGRRHRHPLLPLATPSSTPPTSSSATARCPPLAPGASSSGSSTSLTLPATSPRATTTHRPGRRRRAWCPRRARPTTRGRPRSSSGPTSW